MTILNQLSLKSLHMLAIVSQSQNMQQAAKALCISPSALSHQMNRLEDRLGKQLFYKEGRKQKLLPEAKQWAESISENFINIEQDTYAFLHKQPASINIGIHSALAFNRITPLLGLYLQQHPSLDVRVRMLNCEDDPTLLNLDAFLATPNNHRLYESQHLANEEYIPVCNASLYETLKQTAKNEMDLFNSAPLLELADIESWQTWSMHFSQPVKPSSTIHFSHTILLLQAVLSGQGIAILDRHLVKPQLDSGELVPLHQTPMILPGLEHHFFVKSNKTRDKSVLALKQWLSSIFDSEI